MSRQDKPQKESKKPKEKEPKKSSSPALDKEKLRAEIRAKFKAAFDYEDK
jgi:hypothetical protein